MDTLPALIVELGRARSDPGKLIAVAVLDAIGVLFLSCIDLRIQSVEVMWLARNAADIVQFALDVVGEDWAIKTPEAAVVLQTVLQNQHSVRNVSNSYVVFGDMGNS
jgi:hypothetical protein